MFKSLKTWLCIPVKILPYISTDGSGDSVYGDGVGHKCYPQTKTTTVVDTNGIECISNTQLYMDGNTSIKHNDRIVFEDSEYRIKSIGIFYDGNTGNKSVLVVYL